MSSAEKKLAETTTTASAAEEEKIVPGSSEGEEPAETATTTASVQEEGKITLRSSDGEAFDVDVAVAQQSGFMKGMIKDGCMVGGVWLPKVKARTLSRVLEFMNTKHRSEPTDFPKFEADFFEKLGTKALFDVILAANYLHAQELLDAVSRCTAYTVKGLTVEEVHETFGIVNDFTPEEEEEEENAWAFQ